MNQTIQTNDFSQIVEDVFTKTLVEKYQITTEANQRDQFIDFDIVVRPPKFKNWLNSSILQCWEHVNKRLEGHAIGITHNQQTNEWILTSFIQK